MTYEEIVAYTKNKIADVDVSDYKGHLAAQVNITGEGEGAFYVEINDGAAAVEPYEYFDRDVVLIASADVFVAIVDGKKDAVAAYLTGGLKVEGSLDKAKEFGELLKKSKKKAVKKTAKTPSAKAAKTTKSTKTTKTAAKKETVEKPAEAVKKAAVATAKKVVTKKTTAKKAETK
ncbi:MAG: SCP2 sterol-binding domain-containing protein [Lachnospiraceae bacterium]|nr:SCP2 sterol-binding domain-containing protein [Lachnospiraceae bacterium]